MNRLTSYSREQSKTFTPVCADFILVVDFFPKTTSLELLQRNLSNISFNNFNQTSELFAGEDSPRTLYWLHEV